MSNTEKTIMSYNQIAEQYALDYSSIDPVKSLLIQFIKFLPNKGRILDAGCGQGRDVKVFASFGYEVLGIDASEGLLTIAKKENPKVNFKKVNIEKAEELDMSFHGIWCNAVLHHLNEENAVTSITAMCRKLKENGIFFLSYKTNIENHWDNKYKLNKRFYYSISDKVILNTLLDNKMEVLSFRSHQEKRKGAKEKIINRNWIQIFSKKLKK